MFMSYFEYKVEQHAKNLANPEPNKEEGPKETSQEESKSAAATDSTTTAPVTDAEVTEESKADEPEKKWKDLVQTTNTVGPTHGDTTRSGEEDINKLNEAFVDKLPQIESITIFTA